LVYGRGYRLRFWDHACVCLRDRECHRCGLDQAWAGWVRCQCSRNCIYGPFLTLRAAAVCHSSSLGSSPSASFGRRYTPSALSKNLSVVSVDGAPVGSGLTNLKMMGRGWGAPIPFRCFISPSNALSLSYISVDLSFFGRQLWPD